jgi:hypothetical protein
MQRDAVKSFDIDADRVRAWVHLEVVELCPEIACVGEVGKCVEVGSKWEGSW